MPLFEAIMTAQVRVRILHVNDLRQNTSGQKDLWQFLDSPKVPAYLIILNNMFHVLKSFLSCSLC